jgi:transcriptional regulator with XRE-family HTH domain
MGSYERARERGSRLARRERIRAGEEIRAGRVAAGLSQRKLGALCGLSHTAVGRMERGETRRMSIDRLAVVAAVLGLEIRLSFYPSASPVRDEAHLALIARFRSRVSPQLRWRTEVPIPIPGDQRSADVVLDRPPGGAIVEAETRLNDIQALERRVGAKQRDMGLERVILLVSDTRHNRSVLEHHPELRERFPVGTRAALLALREGRLPDGDAIVIL